MNRNRILKAILVVCLFVVSNPSKAKTITIQEPFISAPASMGKVVLFHDEEGFHISQDDKTYVVEKCWVDSSLQSISSADLEKFLVTGYISISQMDNGEISLTAKNLIKGGGIFGAAVGVFLGKTVVYGISYLTLSGLTAINPALGGVAAYYIIPATEVISNKVAVGAGILLGTATGPV